MNAIPDVACPIATMNPRIDEYQLVSRDMMRSMATDVMRTKYVTIPMAQTIRSRRMSMGLGARSIFLDPRFNVKARIEKTTIIPMFRTVNIVGFNHGARCCRTSYTFTLSTYVSIWAQGNRYW